MDVASTERDHEKKKSTYPHPPPMEDLAQLDRIIADLQQLRVSLARTQQLQDWVEQLTEQKKFTKIIVMLGAGASTGAQIPDFRSPGGLYDQLKALGVSRGEDVFDIQVFRKDPSLFYRFAHMLVPDPSRFRPTATHQFVKALQDQGILLRCFTQNIDGLEAEAGLREDKVVCAHGTFQQFRCLEAECSYTTRLDPDTLNQLKAQRVLRCPEHGTALKPDVVFFGEDLSSDYYRRVAADSAECDCLIVIGTSLKVRPFCNLVEAVPRSIPRVLVNREEVGAEFFQFQRRPTRDILALGECDSFCAQWTRLLQ